MGLTAAEWSDALLASSTESLLGAVRNYLGPVKTPYDKRVLVSKLEAFLKRPQTRAAVLSLLDELDARILGSALLAGPCPEYVLRGFFEGELPLFDLGLRIENLFDRLLLFRMKSGQERLVAVNPLFEEDIRGIALDPDLLFGAASASEVDEAGTPLDAERAIAFFSFVFHSPAVLRKSGDLTKKGRERASALFPFFAVADRLDSLARAFSAAGFFREDGDARVPDRDAFKRALAASGYDLPFYLAGALAADSSSGEGDDTLSDASGTVPEKKVLEICRTLAAAMRALPENFVPARRSLPRWLRIVSWKLGLKIDAARACDALFSLGLTTWAARSKAQGRQKPETRGPVLVVEGSHALHLMPEAGLDERLLALSLARPVSLETVWNLEIDRESVRRAFASGLDARTLCVALETMACSPLPQSLSFSLTAWEEEYRSLRLYRGFVLVADERQRPLVERSMEAGLIAAERLAPGVYFLSVTAQEAVAGILETAGFEAPPVVEFLPSACANSGADSGAASLSAVSALEGRDLDLPPWRSGSSAEALDPEKLLAELHAAVQASGRSEDEIRELHERVDRRLVLTPRQIVESEARSERLEAGGLDYLGKVRVVERALRGRGDRLELLYRLPGAEPVRVLLRPVRLERGEKGLVLEAENLATGGPVRVPLGAVSSVRRLRASLFGEEK
jgi:hypothetical protein